MQSQACESCAKRKVRCDREEPCQNCKKRRDRCRYPQLTPGDKIKRLEALVRSLGGNTEGYAQVSSPTSLPQTPSGSGRQDNNHTTSKSSKDPIILEEDGAQSYVES